MGLEKVDAALHRPPKLALSERASPLAASPAIRASPFRPRECRRSRRQVKTSSRIPSPPIFSSMVLFFRDVNYIYSLCNPTVQTCSNRCLAWSEFVLSPCGRVHRRQSEREDREHESECYLKILPKDPIRSPQQQHTVLYCNYTILPGMRPGKCHRVANPV